MISDKLHALATILQDWLWVAPCHSTPGSFIFDLREFQNYAKFTTDEAYNLQEIHDAVRLLASMRLIQPVEGWPSKPSEELLQLCEDGKFIYSYSYKGMGFL